MLLVEFNTDGAVVAAEDVGEDKAVLQAGEQAVGKDEIVDAPAHVFLSGVVHIAPPGVFHPIGVEGAEAVGKAGGQQVGEFAPFFVGKAGGEVVGFGVFEVDFFVGHVQVAAIDHRLVLIQPQDVVPQGILPLHPIVQADQLPLGVGCVDAQEVKVLKFQGDGAALVVVLGDPQTVLHRQRLPLGKHGGAGITLLFGAVPVLIIAVGGKVGLPRLHFGFLNAEKVRIRLFKKLGKALVQAGSEAVNVPRDKFHRITSGVLYHLGREIATFAKRTSVIFSNGLWIMRKCLLQ